MGWQYGLSMGWRYSLSMGWWDGVAARLAVLDNTRGVRGGGSSGWMRYSGGTMAGVKSMGWWHGAAVRQRSCGLPSGWQYSVAVVVAVQFVG